MNDDNNNRGKWYRFFFRRKVNRGRLDYFIDGGKWP